jgi:hypothetical protein
MDWKFKSLVEVARYVGQNPNSKSFAKKVAGWHKERGKVEIASNSKMLNVLAKKRVVQKIQDLYAQILAAHYQLADFVTGMVEKCQDKMTDDLVFKSPWHLQMSAQAAIDLQKAMEKIVPAIKGLEGLKAVHQIFDDLADNRIDIVRAAFDLAKLGVALPKPIEILLTKHKAEELPPDDGEYITDEIILKRRAELLTEIETERVEFVRERRKVVEQLKQETARSNSFTRPVDGKKGVP